MRQDRCRDAWAAGIIDGEGCILIAKRSGGRYHTLMVCVGQSGHSMPPMLLRLEELYGGKAKVMAPRREGLGVPANTKPRYFWALYSAQAERFLRAIVPFMVQKRDQAELALEYRECAVGPAGRHPNTERNQRDSTRYRERLAELKRA